MRPTAREVVGVLAVGACAATVLDAILLELQRGFFTGGFLARDVAADWPSRVTVLTASLTSDGACAGIGAAVGYAWAGRARLGRLARMLLVLSLGAGPLVFASLVQYEILARLGDAFDLGLMFDLTGRAPGELLAVSWRQLLAPMVSVVAAFGVLWAVLRLVNRRWPGDVRSGLARAQWAGLVGLWVTVLVGTTVVRIASEVQDNGLRRKPSGQLLGTVVTWASDVDRDGYGLLARPADPAPFDASIHPYAIDVPGNGVDEDGLAGDLPVAPGPDARPAAPFAARPPVLLVMLETFRADLLGATAGDTEVTPNLNRLAREGAATTNAYSHNGYTVQSRFHLFTGRLAAEGRSGTLLDDFAGEGYDTAYLSGQDESFGPRAFAIGADRAGFFYDARQDRHRRFTTFTTAGSLGVASDIVLERTAAFLASRTSARPLFLYVNLYDAHYPYWWPGLAPLVSDVHVPQAEITPARGADVRRMYRNAAANVDAAVGRLRQMVAEHVGREPAVILLADHGESLFDDGRLGHGFALDDTQTRIPLVVAGVPLALCEPVGQSDLRDAVLEALARPPSDERASFTACPGHAVFQYLGTLARPRQIAFTRTDGRIVFDIRASAVRVNDGPWTPVDALTGDRRDAWVDLVRYWERLRLRGGPEDAEGDS